MENSLWTRADGQGEAHLGEPRQDEAHQGEAQNFGSSQDSSRSGSGSLEERDSSPTPARGSDGGNQDALWRQRLRDALVAPPSDAGGPQVAGAFNEAGNDPFLSYQASSLISVSPPVPTGPPPSPSPGARRGRESPQAEVPVVTVTESAPPAITSASADRVEEPGPEPGRDDNPSAEGSLHSGTENALIAVGSVGATITVLFFAWLAWRFFMIRRRKRAGDVSPGRMPKLVLSLDGPKQLMVGLASRIPVLRDRIAQRSWSNLDKPYDEAYWKTTFSRSSPTPHDEAFKGIHVHTAITTRSDPEGQSGLSLHPPTPQQPLAAQQAPHGTGLRSRHKASASNASSLSSGFGDGDIIMPPAHGIATTTITAEALAVPVPAAQRAVVVETSPRRETVCTEASEDPLPHFRTVNSWVRQQSGRIKRAAQRDEAASGAAPPVPSMPPEQDLRLMMPDGEEPRRVEEAEAGEGEEYGKAS